MKSPNVENISEARQIRQVFGPISDRLREVDRFLVREIERAEPMVRDVAGYVLGSGGKRLRPALVLLISRITNKLKPLPVISVGIIVGSAGFVVLALTSSPWMFILGIAVFSLGEMTAHPKYYSYIGMVAPKDKVAVYMGYAFLYGLIGSLFGSNFGAIMYERMLEPLAPPSEQVLAGAELGPEVAAAICRFWLIFAVLGVVCLVGMLLYNRFFAEDTPKTNRRAWKIMLGIYFIFCVAGIYFFLQATFLAEQTQWRMMIQSLILLILGSGGIFLSFKRGE